MSDTQGKIYPETNSSSAVGLISRIWCYTRQSPLACWADPGWGSVVWKAPHIHGFTGASAQTVGVSGWSWMLVNISVNSRAVPLPHLHLVLPGEGYCQCGSPVPAVGLGIDLVGARC